MKTLTILGAGSWGTALALALFRSKCNLSIWSISLEEVETINHRNEHVYRLPGIPLDPSITATTDPKVAGKADVVVVVPPAQFVRSTCETFKSHISPETPLILASKGIEDDSGLLMTEVVREIFPQNPLLVLSGPSFAREVALKLPTSVTLAGEDFALTKTLSAQLSSESFQLIPSHDPIGTQIGGACKNIIAIACGIIEGRELGDNARAALLTQGLSEMARLGCALGGKKETFMGLSGLGDLTLTALSSQSRNKSFGLALGAGTPLDELLATKQNLIEGLHTVAGTLRIAKKANVSMPITKAMDDFLTQHKSLEKLLADLTGISLQEEAA